MTKRLTDEELAEIRERAEKATRGPWKWNNRGELFSEDGRVIYYDKSEYNFPIAVSYYDEEFIAHAREDIPKLLAEIERYREVLEEIARGRFPGASYKARQALGWEEGK